MKLVELKNKPLILKNKSCVFCGVDLNSKNSTKEHVIGRRFVPKDKLNGQWNLIVSACKKCNNHKSDLEDDISAITMQPNMWGKFPNSDPKLKSEAIRKQKKSISRFTGNAVQDSIEQLEFKIPFGQNGSLEFTIVTPPQIEPDRIYELARLQITAFFYFITYDKKLEKGKFWQENFVPIISGIKSDWGNSFFRSFMNTSSNWLLNIVSVCGDGFFKVAIRKDPSISCWSWALEWNMNYRIIGFIGNRSKIQKVVDSFNPIINKEFTTSSGTNFSIREDVHLELEDDTLFAPYKNIHNE